MTDGEAEEADRLDLAYRDWLIARRLENQRTSFRLHSLIRTRAVRIGESESLVEITRNLVRAASALWRAASLSERLIVHEDFEEDEFFLTDQIIQSEFIAGPAPRAAPDGAFFSYMASAREALMAIAALPDLNLISRSDVPAWIGLSYKECWVHHQILFDRAVERFEEVLSS